RPLRQPELPGSGDRREPGAAPADLQDDRWRVLPRHRPRVAPGRPQRDPGPPGQEQAAGGRSERQLPRGVSSVPAARLPLRRARAAACLHAPPGVPGSETAWRFTILGYPVGLGAPAWLLLGVVAVLVAAIAVGAALRRRARVKRLLGSRLGESLTPGV